MKQGSERYSERLVLRANELVYDSSEQGYDYIHDEMLEQERERWRAQVRRHFHFDGPATLIDIGSGAGLVPLTIAPFLRDCDTLICSDLSGGMLKVAQRNIEAQGFACRFGYQKITGQIPYRLPFESATADVITMNSVLHHIKETGEFLAEIDRVLKPGGMLVIAHEPNKYFREHPFLRRNYQLLSPIANPKLAVTDISHRLGISRFVRSVYYLFHPNKKKAATEWIDKINRVLIEEKLLVEPIDWDELAMITDIRDQEGFKPDLLLPGYEMLHLETYNHMLLVTIKHFNNPLVKRYEGLLRRKYPTAGATFFLLLRKPRTAART